jgi:hypothetical protein
MQGNFARVSGTVKPVTQPELAHLFDRANGKRI